MADSNDTLLRELQEELRRERYEKMWQRYGTYIIAAAAALVIGVGGYKFYESSQRSNAENAGQQYEMAMQFAKDGKADEAVKAFEALSNEGPRGYAALSKLQLAGQHMKAGRTNDALAVYEELAVDSAIDPLFKNYAALQAASVRLAEADFTEMQNRLNDLVADQSPWRTSAKELLALAAFKAGKTDEARKILTELVADPKTPQSMTDRANVILANITANDLKKPASKVPAPGDAGEKPAEVQKK